WAFTPRGTVGNHPPTADAGPDVSVGADAPVSLDGRASHDLDGDPLTFSWTQTAGPTVTLLNSTTVRPSFDPHGLDDVIVKFQLADINVSASGVLMASTPGVQMVRAHYEDGATKIDSEPSLVLVGIKLDAISLAPESVLTTVAGALASAFGVEKNPPMVLVTD